MFVGRLKEPIRWFSSKLIKLVKESILLIVGINVNDLNIGLYLRVTLMKFHSLYTNAQNSSHKKESIESIKEIYIYIFFFQKMN